MVFMVGSCRLFSCGIPCFVLSTRLSVGTTRSLDDVVAMGNSHAANEQASMLCNSLFLEHSSIHAHVSGVSRPRSAGTGGLDHVRSGVSFFLLPIDDCGLFLQPFGRS